MPTPSRDRGRDRGRGGSSSAAFTLEFQQEQLVPKPRPCRIIIGVDVSGSMGELINAVICGITEINSVLDDQDLVSVIDFAETRQTIFQYLERPNVDWPALWNTLKTDVKQSNRGISTALWDAIGYILKTTPRDAKYRPYKPELIIFTDGEDNCSKEHDRNSIQKALKHPGIRHVHITIIDASDGGNAALKAICTPIQHCSFVQVKASHEAIQRAFTDVIKAITGRLTIAVKLNDVTDALTTSLNQLIIEPKARPPTIYRGNRRGTGRGRKPPVQENCK